LGMVSINIQYNWQQSTRDIHLENWHCFVFYPTSSFNYRGVYPIAPSVWKKVQEYYKWMEMVQSIQFFGSHYRNFGKFVSVYANLCVIKRELQDPRKLIHWIYTIFTSLFFNLPTMLSLCHEPKQPCIL